MPRSGQRGGAQIRTKGRCPGQGKGEVPRPGQRGGAQARTKGRHTDNFGGMLFYNATVLNENVPPPACAQMSVGPVAAGSSVLYTKT